MTARTSSYLNSLQISCMMHIQWIQQDPEGSRDSCRLEDILSNVLLLAQSFRHGYPEGSIRVQKGPEGTGKIHKVGSRLQEDVNQHSPDRVHMSSVKLDKMGSR